MIGYEHGFRAAAVGEYRGKGLGYEYCRLSVVKSSQLVEARSRTADKSLRHVEMGEE